MTRRMIVVFALLLALPLPALAATVRVNASQVPLRSAPDTSSRILMRVDKGAVLDLVDVVREWYRVRDPRTKTEGYILASLVELLPGDPADAGQTRVAGSVPASQRPAAAPPTAPPAAARKTPPKPGEWRDSGFFTLGGSFQNKGTAFEYSFSPPEYAYAEEAILNAHYPLKSGPAFEVGGGFRAFGNLALGATVSVFSQSSLVSVDGTVPHPLYLNRDRVVSGTFSSSRTEAALHFQATWVVPVGPRMLVSLAGGPSYIHVQQGIATGINLQTVYPYDTTSITGAQTSDTSRGGVGFNAGGDVVYFFTRTLGVGGMARFSRATVTFPTPSGRVKTYAGAVQAGVTLRVRLGAAPPPRAPRKGSSAPAPPPPPKPRGTTS